MGKPTAEEYPAEILHLIFENMRPALLWHYTSSSGLLGILESHNIWASDVRALNDEKELKHAAQVLEHAFKNHLRARGIRDEDDVRSISSQFRGMGDLVRGHCVCSFSESGDLLSQWRAYASDGRGIAIGLNTELLEADASDSSFSLGKCLYNYEDQYRVCASYLDLVMRDYDIGQIVSNFPLALPTALQNFIYTIGPFLKHPAFVDEREWRLVSGQNHLYSAQWKYRAIANGLSAYIELPLPRIFCAEKDDEPQEHTPHFQFTVGPKARKTPTNYILQALSQKILGKAYGISQSSVPYID